MKNKVVGAFGTLTLAATVSLVAACAAEDDGPAADHEMEEVELGRKDQTYLVANWSNHWPTVAARPLQVCITLEAGTTTSRAVMEFLVQSAVLTWVNAVQPVANVTLNAAVFTCQDLDGVPLYDLEVALRSGTGGFGQAGDWFFGRHRFQVFEQGFGGGAAPLWPRILHEMGHVFGAADTYVAQGSAVCQANQPSSVMCNGGNNLTADDINGVRQAFRLARPWLHNYSVGFTTYKSAASGRCMDAWGAGTANGTSIVIYDCGPWSNQVWRWNLNTRQVVGEASGKCLDVAGAGTENGTPVHLWDCHGGSNQQWEWLGNGKLRGVGSGKCLDVTNVGTANGTPLQIWDCSGGSNQVWYST